MTSSAKLYARLLDNPSSVISFRDFERLLATFGFALKRTRGSHRSYRHVSVPDLIVVQPRGSEAKPYQVRQFLDTIDRFGLTLDAS